MGQLTLKEQAVLTLVKQGPWATLAVALLLFIGYELHQFGNGAGVAVTDYVQQSSRNIEAIQAAVSAMVSSSAITAEHVQTNGELIANTVQLMSEAKTLMAPLPADRQKQMLILTEIRDAVREKN